MILLKPEDTMFSLLSSPFRRSVVAGAALGLLFSLGAQSLVARDAIRPAGPTTAPTASPPTLVPTQAASVPTTQAPLPTNATSPLEERELLRYFKSGQQGPSAQHIPLVEYHTTEFRFSDEVMMRPEWFEDQMRWLSEEGYTTLNSADFAAFLRGEPFPQRSVVLTFDIGVGRRSDFAERIVPALRRYHHKAVFFVTVNTNVITDVCGQDERLCWDELRAWADEGLISVESHSVFHVDFNELSPAEQAWEVRESKKIIEEKIGRPVLGFAFPFDHSTDPAIQLLLDLGYEFAVAGHSRADRSARPEDPDRFQLPRVYPYSSPKTYPVLSGSSGETFEQMIRGLVGLAAAPSEPRASAEPKPSQTSPIASAPDRESLSLARKAACEKIDRIADPMDRLYALNRLTFQTDVSPVAQSKLDSEVIIDPSCNLLPGNQPVAIVLHFTRGPLTGAVSTFQQPHNTSAHYIIDRDGTVIQLVPEAMKAFHASCSGYRGNCVTSCPICDGPNGELIDPNTRSIGIELVNQGQVDPKTFTGPIYEDYQMAFGWRYWEDYPEAQIEALKVLVEDIAARWGIPMEMVIGHSRIQQKTDPGPALNLFWDRFGSPARKALFPSYAAPAILLVDAKAEA